jgi:peptidyl-tRNA hydrolase, PTH1 family
MKIVVGLGNPGRQYEATRHNVGFDTLRRLAERHAAEPLRSRFESLVAEVRLGEERALLVWPQTYMNRSGIAVRQVAGFYKTPLEDLLVVCDDINLPVGRLRMRIQGSAGGHNGLKDIAHQLGSEGYPRLRIGVGDADAGRDVVGHVLGKFRPAEREEVDWAIATASDAVACWATRGPVEAMNRYNTAAK